MRDLEMTLAEFDTFELLEEIKRRFKTLVLYGFLNKDTNDEREELRSAVKDDGNDELRCLALADLLKDEIKRNIGNPLKYVCFRTEED